MTPELERAMAASPFTALGLDASLVRAVLDENYTQPSPIQTEVIPHALAGRDVLAGAQTGTGKTAAFVLPILQHLGGAGRRELPRSRAIRALIPPRLARELAVQIAERVAAYGRHLRVRHAVIYGGVSQRRQEIALQASPDIVVATPGRLIDLLQQKLVRLDGVTHFVLDEADRMLDMGFVRDVRRITALLPTRRQTLFFSATISSSIETLARTMLVNPARVSITPTVTTAETVDQSVIAFVARAEKRALLERVLREDLAGRTLVFMRTKRLGHLSEQLERAGIEFARDPQRNKTQAARERAIEAFRSGTTRVLVATDVAARGLDIDGISLVINFDLPNVAESYVHRIGRTGRAGATGRALSFVDREERHVARRHRATDPPAAFRWSPAPGRLRVPHGAGRSPRSRSGDRPGQHDGYEATSARFRGLTSLGNSTPNSTVKPRSSR